MLLTTVAAPRSDRTAAPPAAKAPAPASSVTDDFSDVLKLQRRSWHQGSSSSASSESCPSPRALEAPAPRRQAVVIEQQGVGKVVHRPDGTVVWEPVAPADGSSGSAKHRQSLRQLALEVAAITGLLVGAVGTMTGAVVALYQVEHAQSKKQELTSRQLTATIANSVTAVIAGTLTGIVLGPVTAARTIGGVLLKPLLLGAAVHMVVTRVGRWRGSVERLVAKLQSGDSAKVLEALRWLIAQAAKANPRFCKEFCRLAGMEALVKLLADALPDCPWLHMLAQALAELAKDVQCREALVACGGVPRLVGLLRHSNPAINTHALAALATLAENPLAQDAIREAGGLARLVELTASAAAATNHANTATASYITTSSITAITGATAAPPPAPSSAASVVGSAGSGSGAAAAGGVGGVVPAVAVSHSRAAASTLLPAIKLLQALALDPANKAAIGAAGGVAALLDVVRASGAKSEVQAAAVAALHNLLRGSPDNQRALAALPNASEVLRGALAGCGPCWAPAKSDLHALLNVLARHAGAQESSGFVVVQGAVAGRAPSN